MGRNSSHDVDASGKPSLTRLRSQFDFGSTLILGLSFAAGVLLAIGAFATFANTSETESARVEPAESSDSDSALARQSQTPSVDVEVAGVVCEDEREVLGEEGSARDVLPLWNAAVQSPGDSCTPPFHDTLGATWVMDGEASSFFGSAQSFYEFSVSDDGRMNGLSIVLAPDDSLLGERDAIISVIDLVWGQDVVDWEFSCTDSTNDWSGVIRPDDLTLEISGCDADR